MLPVLALPEQVLLLMFLPLPLLLFLDQVCGPAFGSRRDHLYGPLMRRRRYMLSVTYVRFILTGILAGIAWLVPRVLRALRLLLLGVLLLLRASTRRFNP